jgi:hypothetical protein
MVCLSVRVCLFIICGTNAGISDIYTKRSTVIIMLHVQILIIRNRWLYAETMHTFNNALLILLCAEKVIWR